MSALNTIARLDRPQARELLIDTGRSRDKSLLRSVGAASAL
jgi:hypothetical protein